jgi:hypothetical protein
MIPSRVLMDYEPFHSNFQIRQFIVFRTGITLYGAYKQVVREIWARLNGLYGTLGDLRLAIPRDALPPPSSPTSWQSKSKDVPPVGFAEFEQFVALKDTCRELTVLLAYATIIRSRLGDLSQHRVGELEADYWVCRTKLTVARDIIHGGRLGSDTIELIQSMPGRYRDEITNTLATASGVERLIEWYWTYELDVGAPEDLLALVQPLPMSGQIRWLLNMWETADVVNRNKQFSACCEMPGRRKFEAKRHSDFSQFPAPKNTSRMPTGVNS